MNDEYVKLIVAFLLGLTFMLMAYDFVYARWRPEYAQNSPEIQRWFREQTVPPSPAYPSGGGYCCTDADGEAVEEDIRNGQYWVKAGGTVYATDKKTYEMGTGQELAPPDGMDKDGWVPVPDAVVIKEPNKFGRPVVWWYRGINPDGTWKMSIRCYAPGPLL